MTLAMLFVKLTAWGGARQSAGQAQAVNARHAQTQAWAPGSDDALSLLPSRAAWRPSVRAERCPPALAKCWRAFVSWC
jgi:hypothetical protein